LKEDGSDLSKASAGRDCSTAASIPVTIGRSTTKFLENCLDSSPRQRTPRHLYPHRVTANAAVTIAVHTSNKSRNTQKGLKPTHLSAYLFMYLR